MVGFVASVSEGWRSRRTACEARRRLDEIKVGEVLTGVVRQSGGADSAWVDCDVVRRGAGGREVVVNARLRARDGKKPLKEGRVVTCRVHRVQPASARWEVVEDRDVPVASGPSEGCGVARSDWRHLEELRVGDPVRGRVVHVYEKGALLEVDVDRAGRNGERTQVVALLPRFLLPEGWALETDLVFKQGTRLIRKNDNLDAFVFRAMSDNGHLRVTLQSMAEEEVEAIRAERRAQIAKRKRRLAPRAKPVVGAIRAATVHKVLQYGLMVDFGWKERALLHWSKLPEELRFTWRDEFPRGATLDVVIEALKPGGQIEVAAVPPTSVAVEREVQARTAPDSQRGMEESVRDQEDEDEDEDVDEDEDDEFLDDDYLEGKYG